MTSPSARPRSTRSTAASNSVTLRSSRARVPVTVVPYASYCAAGHEPPAEESTTMEMTSYEPGTPSWVDIGVPDMDAAVAFYGGLFGWEFTEAVEEAGGYRQALKNGKRLAGFGPAMNPGPPFWTTYIATDNVD